MTQGDLKPLLRKAMERMAVDIAPPEKPIHMTLNNRRFRKPVICWKNRRETTYDS